MRLGLFDVYVKNVGDTTIELVEIQDGDENPFELAPDEEINLMEERAPYGHYTDSQAVLRALNELTGTVLYQQREAGNLEYRVVPRSA